MSHKTMQNPHFLGVKPGSIHPCHIIIGVHLHLVSTGWGPQSSSRSVEISVDIYIYTIWLFNIAMENPWQMEVLMGKSSINVPFSMAMWNNQRVTTTVTTIVNGGRYNYMEYGRYRVYGRYNGRVFMVVILWFINQHSHHWGATSCRSDTKSAFQGVFHYTTHEGRDGLIKWIID